MPLTSQFGFYLDQQLTLEFTPNANVVFLGAGEAILGFLIDINTLDASSQQQDLHMWLGSPDDAGYVLTDAASPGVTNISVSAFDDGSVGGSDPISRISLAKTQAGLDLAVGGQPLNLNVTAISGGASNAVDFWVRYKVPQGSPEFGCNETIYYNLHLKTQDVALATTQYVSSSIRMRMLFMEFFP